MQLRLGAFLRQLRQERGLSQSQAARLVGIGRVTLNRWEQDIQHPRLYELNALLTGLSAQKNQRRYAHQLLGKSEEVVPPQIEMVRAAEEKGLGHKPHGGDMLRSLRLRQGLPQEVVAQRMAVTVRTIRNWEKAETWPSLTQLHTLCFVLDAQIEEMLALTQGGVSLEVDSSEAETLSVDDLYLRCHALHHYTSDRQTIALRELRFLALEAQAWPVAIASSAGQRMLSFIYSCHANYYCASRRFLEAGIYADKALASWPSDVPPNQGTIQAGIASAVSAVNRGPKLYPQRGLDILRHWLDAAYWPDFKAWILSDMAIYTAMMSNYDESLLLAQQASAVAVYCETGYELFLRRLDEAQILLQSGKPTQALALMENTRQGKQPEHLVKVRLLESKALLALENYSQAQERLQIALNLLETWPLDHLRLQALDLTQRF